VHSTTHRFRPHGPLAVLAAVALAMSVGFAEESPAPSESASPKEAQVDPLDLRAPSLNELYTEEQIEALLAKARNEEESDVEVEGAREPPPNVTPNVWPGIATPFWALLHPSQAWRIFFPLPPDQTRGKEKKPDATDPEDLPELAPQLPFR
jgi:hypothetical protein